MRREAILCVDDEAIILMALKEELKMFYGDRFVYETALCAEDALRIIDDLVAEKIRVILIISDWLMPGMRGDVFLKTVKKDHHGVKALLVTGYAEQHAIDRIVREGVVENVIQKPWDHDVLRSSIDRCLTALT